MGISARIAVSVLRQYLDCVASKGFLPRVIRVDLGTEIIMFRDAYLGLRQLADKAI